MRLFKTIPIDISTMNFPIRGAFHFIASPASSWSQNRRNVGAQALLEYLHVVAIVLTESAINNLKEISSHLVYKTQLSLCNSNYKVFSLQDCLIKRIG